MISDIKELNFPEYATLSKAEVVLPDMGQRSITGTVEIDGDIAPDFSYDWIVEFRGERYILPYRKVSASKDNQSEDGKYTLPFIHEATYLLQGEYFVTLMTDGAYPLIDKYKASINLNLKEFVDYFGKVLQYYFGDRITVDLNPEWQYSEEAIYVDINYTYLWDLLQNEYELYKCRWSWLSTDAEDGSKRYVIRFGYDAKDVSHIFEYGHEGGLLKFEQGVQSPDIRNYLLGRGVEQNLPYRYFKDKDANNPLFAADPDWVKELSLVPFTELRSKEFRDYVQGWKTQHKDEYPGYVPPANSGYAYEKGLSDKVFDPVEFVKDDESIAKYGVRKGSVEPDDSIYPSIQGVVLDGIGRVDEVVDVEKVLTDNQEVITNEVITELDGYSESYSLFKDSVFFNARTRMFYTPELSSLTFDVIPPDNPKVTFTINDISVKSADGQRTIAVEEVSKNSFRAVNIPKHDQYYISIYGQISPIVWTEEVEATYSIVNIKLRYVEVLDENVFKNTFDIWIKNIWQTSKGASEDGDAYAKRVWEPILGDKDEREATVSFSTGFLRGTDYEFRIADGGVHYDTSKELDGVRSEWRLTLIKSEAELEATGKYLPNVGINAIAGDFFYFTGIELPHQYVIWAEQRVQDRKTAQLEEVKEINPTWVIDTDPVRLQTLTEGEGADARKMFDLLDAGVLFRATDKRIITDKPYIQLYAQSVTFSYGESDLPKVSMTLSDEVVPVLDPVQLLQGEMSEVQRAISGYGNLTQLIRKVCDELYLRKDGLKESSISETTFRRAVLAEGGLQSKDFREGAVGGQGFRVALVNGKSVGEFDRVVVREDLNVNTLVINQISVYGGKEIRSAARMECTRVDDTEAGYVCYFNQKKGSVGNLFKVDDVAFSQVFDAENTEVKRYKRKVLEVGVNSITLAKTEFVDGDGIPEAGDVIAQYGSYSDKARQFVIITDVIGGGYIRMLGGLDSVSATGREYLFEGQQGGVLRFCIGDKSDSEKGFMEWTEAGGLKVKGSVEITGGQAKTDIDELKKDKDNLAKSLGYKDYADMVKQTGQNGTIIDEGFINTLLLKAKSITADMIDVKTLEAMDLTLKGSFRTVYFEVTSLETLKQIADDTGSHWHIKPTEEGYGRSLLFRKWSQPIFPRPYVSIFLNSSGMEGFKVGSQFNLIVENDSNVDVRVVLDDSSQSNVNLEKGLVYTFIKVSDNKWLAGGVEEQLARNANHSFAFRCSSTGGASGGVNLPTGFKAKKTATGAYNITYTAGTMEAAPVVSVTGTSGSTPAVFTAATSKGRIIVYAKDLSGNAIDAGFYCIVKTGQGYGVIG